MSQESVIEYLLGGNAQPYNGNRLPNRRTPTLDQLTETDIRRYQAAAKRNDAIVTVRNGVIVDQKGYVRIDYKAAAAFNEMDALLARLMRRPRKG